MPKNKRNSRSSTRRFSDPLLAAAVTAAIYWLVMLLGDFVPFGVNTPAVTDAKLQYLDLFAYCRDVLTGQNSAAYTFSNTLGGSAAAIWAYYLASPFNLLVLLFPKEQMNLFLEVLISTKVSAASASFAYFINDRFREKVRRDLTLLLSVGYGLMQYTLAQESNVMWLDGVILLPFIVLGVHRAVHARRFRPAQLAVPAALSVLVNWYTGGLNYLFSAVWFLYEMLRTGKKKEAGGSGGQGDAAKSSAWGGCAAKTGRYLFGMGLGLMLAAALFLPTVLALRQGKAGNWNPVGYVPSTGFRGNPFSVLRSYRIGEMSDASKASFFCGTPAALGTAAFFLSGRIKRREKLAALVPLVTVWLACFWKPLFYIFSLFMTSTSYWYRFGYQGSFILLYLAAFWAGSLPRKGGFRSGKRWLVIPGAGAVCLILVLVSQKVWPAGGNGSSWIAILMIAVMTLSPGYIYAPDDALEILERRETVRRNRRILAGVLVLFGLLEAFLETRAILRIYHTDTAEEYASYSREEQAQIEELLRADEEGFYRISQTATRITNVDGLTGAYLDAMAYGYASISGYTSCPENIQLELLDRLGYRKEYESFNIVNTSFLPADSLLGVRYVLSPYEIPGLEKVPELGSRNGKAVYRNPFALPAAMIIDGNAASPEPEQGNPFAYTEYLYRRISGQEAKLWIPEQAQKTYDRGIAQWTLSVPSGEGAKYCLYGNLPTGKKISYDDSQWWKDAGEQGKLTASEGWSFGYGGWLSPSVFYIPVEEGQKTAVVTLEIKEEPGLRQEQFYALDTESLSRLSAQIRERAESVSDLEIRGGKISCRVYAREGQKLLLSVPASTGWTARVNGQKTEIEAFEGSLMEIPLVPGENYITMQYRVPGLTAGILLTLAGLGILALWSMDKQKFQRQILNQKEKIQHSVYSREERVGKRGERS